MLHLINDRVMGEPRGTSVIEACQWVIDARNEAMSDWRKISHRSSIRVLYIDMEDTTKLATVKRIYKDAIKDGEVMVLPAVKGEAEFEDLQPVNVTNFLSWIQYLESFFYSAVGVPRVIATSENYTEAASKVGYATFEPVYTKEQLLLEQEIWNQLAMKIKFNRPPSLMGDIQEDEAANTGQTGFQPNDTQLGVGE